MKKDKVKYSAKTYTAAYENGWIDSLAFYILLVKIHPGKSFYFKPGTKTKLYKKLSDQTNVSLGLVIRHIKKLESLDMIQVLEVGEIRLVGNNLKEIRRNSEKIMYVEAGIDTYQDIKKLLYAIPLLSNLRSQSRTIEKKKHLLDIKHAVDNRQSVSKRDYKSLTRFLKKHDGVIQVNQELNCTLGKIKELLARKSNSTICRVKAWLKEKGVISYSNSWHQIFSGVTYQDYIYLLSYDLLGLRGLFYYKGSIWMNKPSSFTLLS